jgi:PAS domain S-box-containing protein
MTDQERSKAQLLEELAESEEKWRSLAKNAPIFILIVNRVGVIQFLNRAQPGYSIEESIGKSIFDFIEPEYHDLVRASLKKVFSSGETMSFEMLAAGPDGSKAWYETNVGPIRHGEEIVSVSHISTDITARKEAKASLQEARDTLEQRVQERTAEVISANKELRREIELRRHSEERYRLLVETTNDLIWEVDQSGVYTYVSPSATGLLGNEPDELIGKTPFEFMPPKEVERLRPLFDEKIASGEGHRAFEVLRLHKNGRPLVHETNVSPVFDADGNCCGFRGISRDVTERKQTEEALRQSEEQYHQIFDSIADNLFVGNLEGRIVAANPAACETHGYTQEEIIGLPVLEVIHPNEHQRFDEFLEVVETGGTYRTESVGVKKDGSTFDVEVFGGPFIYRGRPHLLAIVRDITDRKKAEEALRQNHEELQAIYDGMVDGLLIADIETKKFVRANDAICRMLGYSQEEMLSLSVMDIPPHDDPAGALETFEAQAGGRLVVAENLPMLRKDGSVFYGDITANRLDYQGKPCLIGFFRDNTERKKAEKELRESEETARALINAPTESFLLIESDGTVVTLNETAARRLGGSVQELVGKSVYDFMPPDVAQPRKAHAEEVIRSGEPICFEDLKEGRFFQSCIYPVFLASGKVTRLAIYAQDITERKAAEEVVLEEREHLKRSLEASDRERQLVSYDIHEGIAQHLTGAIMQFHAFSELQSDNAEKASEVFDSGLGLLVHALAEARRLIGGVRPPILDEMGIVAAVEHLVSDIQSKGGPEIEFEADVEFRRLAPSTENSFFRIIQESLANACKHSESDKVRIALVQQDKTLHIEIQDWGVGFDKDNVEESSFGLEGIRERARLLGGNVIIDSKPGKGTRVVVRLPLPEEA